MVDAALSAFSVFFTQSPSFLYHQRTMASGKGRSNLESLFGAHEIPCDNQIRKLLDDVSPTAVFPFFEQIFERLEQTEHLSSFWAFDEQDCENAAAKR